MTDSATLYICATPIGNLGDMTIRAIETLKSVDLILAEDTRVTRKLLNHYNIQTPLKPYHAHNEDQQIPIIIQHLENNKSLALVSDAGMPGIADPAYQLVQAIYKANLNVTVLPGASAPLMALILSGIPPMPYLFLGFLPRKASQRQTFIEQYKTYPETLIFFETPHRILKALQDLLDILGDRNIAIGRELTKKFEQIHRGNVSNLIGYFEKHPPKGEMTLVIEGYQETNSSLSTEDIKVSYKQLLQNGLSRKDAVKELARTLNYSKNELYQLLATGD